jgi:hypothetical protein
MSLPIGRTRRGKTLALSDAERATHVHVLGASGYGKSTLLENMIRADILAGRGVCLIDPHGTLADSIVSWCASRRVQEHRRVHLFEPSRGQWCVGFNPLRLDAATAPTARVDAMVAGCAQVWGGESMSGTPLLKKCLRALFYALAVHGLTLAEAPELMSSTGDTRRTLTAGLPDYVFNALWREFNALSRRDFAEQFSSTANRMIEFLSSPIVRRIVGQRERALDLGSAMERGEVVIVNLALGGSISQDNARLLGTLLTSELFLLAKTRDPARARSRPFYLYIDECYDYLTTDVEQMLDQTRKFGLHVVLSHQRLAQLGEPHCAIRSGVMAGAQTKIVFGNLQDADAEEMAREMLRDQFDLERPKHVLDKPIVVDEVPFWLESVSASEGRASTASEAASEGWSTGYGASQGAGDAFRVSLDAAPELVGQSLMSGSISTSGESGSRATGRAETSSSSVTHGRSQTLKPVREIMATAVHSLEEETHRAILRLRGLPVGTAIVRPRGRTAIEVRVPLAPSPMVSAAHVEAFRQAACVGNPSVSSVPEADEALVLRQASLLAPPAPPAPEQWYEPVEDD